MRGKGGSGREDEEKGRERVKGQVQKKVVRVFFLARRRGISISLASSNKQRKSHTGEDEMRAAAVSLPRPGPGRLPRGQVRDDWKHASSERE